MSTRWRERHELARIDVTSSIASVDVLDDPIDVGLGDDEWRREQDVIAGAAVDRTAQLDDDDPIGDFVLMAEPGLPRLPTLDEWVALRAKQIGGVIAAWREIRHPAGIAFEHLEVDALDDERPIAIVRALFDMPVCAVLSLTM